MSTTSMTRAIVALNLPDRNTDFISYAKSIQKAMAGNPNFTSSAAKVNQLLTDVNALDLSQTAMGTKPPTTTAAARDVHVEVVKADLRVLKTDVQTAADAKPASAEAIILSSGMSIRKTTSPSGYSNEVVDDVQLGSVILYATGGGPHEWQQSSDAGLNIIRLDATLVAKTVVSNLEPGKQIWFRNRAMYKNNMYGEWSTWLSFFPKQK